MLEKIIKKAHTKIIFSFYGILSMISMLLPLSMLGIGIWFTIAQITSYGPIWIVVGVLFALFSIRKLKDFFPNFKYASNPKKFPIYQALVNDGVNLDEFNQEFEDAKVNETLSKNNPLLESENFIFGYSQVSFFVLKKSDILWVYEYNGNGLVFYDKHKIYGFTFFPTVDGNDHAIEALEDEMPYLYYGIDFDYKTIMHTDFDNTVIYIEEERKRFLEDPEGYKERKEAEKKAREEEETRRLEEERARQMEAIMENHNEEEAEALTLEETHQEESTNDALDSEPLEEEENKNEGDAE